MNFWHILGTMWLVIGFIAFTMQAMAHLGKVFDAIRDGATRGRVLGMGLLSLLFAFVATVLLTLLVTWGMR